MAETEIALSEACQQARQFRAMRAAHIERLAMQGLGVRDIAHRLGISKSAVSRTLRRLGHSPPRRELLPHGLPAV